jgi:hypothetical protein
MRYDAVSDQLLAALARLDALRPAVEGRAPWPLAERFDHTPEASWGPPELLAHLAEMVAYWDAELSRVATSGEPEPVEFGRVATDTVRIEAIGRERAVPPGQMFDRISNRIDAFLTRWASWSPAERARIGLHPARGEISVEDGAERFIVGHLGEHATQLESILGPADADG